MINNPSCVEPGNSFPPNTLGYIDRVIFELQAFSWQRRMRYLGQRANRQVKIDKRLVKGHFGGRQGGCTQNA
jgi:hypothetical protein